MDQELYTEMIAGGPQMPHMKQRPPAARHGRHLKARHHIKNMTQSIDA